MKQIECVGIGLIMDTEYSYPTLRLGVLHNLLSLRERLLVDGGFLRAATCPYDLETVELLEKIFTERVVEKRVEVPVSAAPVRGVGRPKKEDVAISAEDQEEVQDIIQGLLVELKKMGQGAASLETKDKIQIIKTKAVLIEQLIQKQERLHNVKRISNFEAVVISILDDLIGEDDRLVFLQRLEPYRD